ncbi:MAG: DUF4860 domain-containing protein [Intestinibacillus sp.]
MDAKGNSHTVGSLAVLVVCCVFAASVVLSLAFGVRAYQGIVTRTQEGYDSRIALSYIGAKVHAFDVAGSVSVGTFDGLSALYLEEWSGGERYHTILYAQDGWMYELYCRQGDSFSPEDGEQLLAVESLAFSQQGQSISAVLTDAEGNQDYTQIYLRSDGGAA